MRFHYLSTLLLLATSSWSESTTPSQNDDPSLITAEASPTEKLHPYRQRLEEWLDRNEMGNDLLLEEFEWRLTMLVVNSMRAERSKGPTPINVLTTSVDEESRPPSGADGTSPSSKLSYYRRRFEDWLLFHGGEEEPASYDGGWPLSSSSDGEKPLSYDKEAGSRGGFMGWYGWRFAMFVANSMRAERHNRAFERGDTSWVMTVDGSPFADLSDEEFRSRYLMESQDCSATHVSSVEPLSSVMTGSVGKIPESIDWRTKGILTPVKNQKSCGSCWTFSTTGTLEAHTCLNDPSLDCTHWTGLAEQQLLDCSSAFDNHGCDGGLPSHAFQYVKESDGLDAEDDYPYRADSDGPCLATGTDSPPPFGRVAEVYNITSRDEDDLVNAVGNVGPVSVAFQVAEDFRLYSHGVYDSYDVDTGSTVCKDGRKDVNHAVVAVGYGMTDGEDGEPFYIVRNSWGSTWGMEGYFWIERGENLCGISDCASFPIVPAAKTKGGVGVMEAGGDVARSSLRG